MLGKSWAVVGWVLVVGAVLCGLLTVPTLNGKGSATGGSLTVDATPLRTTVNGTGQFTHETFWTASLSAAVACGLALAAGGRSVGVPGAAGCGRV